jgi:hypothetical protein
MKKTFLILTSVLLLVACNRESVQANELSLDLEHPNRESMEYRLNHYPEEISVIEVDWGKWNNEDLVQHRYAFKVGDEGQETLFLVFCKTQADALKVANENFLPKSDTLSWGVTGSVLFVVQGEAREMPSSLLSDLAGEE